MASYRHLARQCVMQTIFAVEFRGGQPEEILDSLLDEFADKIDDRSFAHETLKGVLEKKDAILDTIKVYAPEWPVEKIAPIDRSILEIGIYEIVYSQDIPPVVAINESVEMAKEFGDNSSPKFINGVLSNVMKDNDGKKLQ